MTMRKPRPDAPALNAGASEPPNFERRVEDEQNEEFNWSNQDWAGALLPTIRIANLFCMHDANWVREKTNLLRRSPLSDEKFEVIQEFNRVREHLKAIVSMIDAAETKIMTCSARPIAPSVGQKPSRARMH